MFYSHLSIIFLVNKNIFQVDQVMNELNMLSVALTIAPLYPIISPSNKMLLKQQ